MSMYAVNATTLGISTYSLSPVAIAELDNDVFVLVPTKLHEQTGSTDDSTPIVSYVTTGALRLGEAQAVNCPKAVVVVQGSSLRLDWYTKELGAVPSAEFETRTITSVLDEYEILLGTKHTARSYKFKITFDDFLDSFGVYVNPVRHRRG